MKVANVTPVIVQTRATYPAADSPVGLCLL